MFFVRLMTLFGILALSGCGGIDDDLTPSGDDKRPAVEAGSTGTQVGQIMPEFSIQDTLDVTHALSNELISANGVVLYFTMWCPICDSHSSHLRTHIIPDFPFVNFYLVDYVSGSVTASRSSQISNGYSNVDVLVDDDLSLYNLFGASMGTTIVIDSTGVVRMNEDYKDGVKLRGILQALP